MQKHMATHISPEQRAKILSAIKDEGMSIIDAAKTFLVKEETIKKWMRKQSRNGHTSSTEVQRLKQENQDLKTIIGEMVLHQKKRKSPFLSS
jgi:transposase-like protein